MNLLAAPYSKVGLYRNAYDVLSEQVCCNTGDLTTHLNLMTVCAEGGDVAKAGGIAAKAKQIFRDSVDAAILLGAAETMLGRLDQAYSDFAAARLVPSRADARFFAVLQPALKNGIVDSDPHHLLAECLLKQDPANVQQALKELDRAVDLIKKSVAACSLRGKLLLESGHPKQAPGDLALARQQDPLSRTALYNTVRAYQAEGCAAQVRALFQQLRSENADALNEIRGTRFNDALTGKAGPQE